MILEVNKSNIWKWAKNLLVKIIRIEFLEKSENKKVVALSHLGSIKKRNSQPTTFHNLNQINKKILAMNLDKKI